MCSGFLSQSNDTEFEEASTFYSKLAIFPGGRITHPSVLLFVNRTMRNGPGKEWLEPCILSYSIRMQEWERTVEEYFSTSWPSERISQLCGPFLLKVCYMFVHMY